MSGAKISPQEGDLRPLHEDEPLPLPATEKTPIEIGIAKDLFKKAAKGKIRFENDDNEGPAIQQQVSLSKIIGGKKNKGILAAKTIKALTSVAAVNTLAATIMPTDNTNFEDKDTVPLWLFPYSTFRNVWDIFIFLVVSYNCFYTPLQIMILYEDVSDMQCYTSGSFWLDLIIDMLFWVDTALNFFFAFKDNETKMVVANKTAVRAKFLRSSSFFINIIASSQPFFTVVTCSLDPSRAVLVMLQLPRMMRIFLFNPQFTTFRNYLSEKRQVKINESMYRMGVVLFFILLGNTGLGCLYYSIGFASDVTDVCSDEMQLHPTWVIGDPLLYPTASDEYCANQTLNEANLASGALREDTFGTKSTVGRFLRAIYFMMQTLFTIGYGDSVIPQKWTEKVFASIFMMLGTFIYGLVIANMTSLLANIDVLRMRFRQEMDAMNGYMDMRDVPEGLKQRIKIFFDFIYMKQYGMLEEQIMTSLPFKIREDLATIHARKFNVVPFFKNRGDIFNKNLAHELVLRTYAPGSILIFQHERQRELFVVTSGQIEIVTTGMEQSIFSLRPGDYVGDYQLLFGVEHKFGAKADVFVETIVLTIQGLKRALNDHSMSPIACMMKQGHFRGADRKDAGVAETKKVYEEKMAKYRKLHENMNKTSSKMQAMMASVDDNKHKGIIMPYDPFHVAWDILLMMCTFYLSIMVPVRIRTEYSPDPNYTPPFDYTLIVDYLVDVIFLVDIYLQARIFAYLDISTGRENIVTDKTLIQQNYTSSFRFKLDILASIPIDIFGLTPIGSSHLSYLRIIHLVRFFEFHLYIAEWVKHMEDVYDFVIPAAARASLQMSTWTIVLVTWTCAVWDIMYFKNYHPDWKVGGKFEDENSFWPAFYWTFTTFTTVGYGDIYPETIPQTTFALISGAVGAAFCAAIIANVTSFVHNIDVSEDNVEHKRKVVQSFLVDQGINKNLQLRLENYFKHIEQDRMGIEEEHFLRSTLPSNLRDDMLLHITSDMVLACEFFQDCDSGFVRSVMLNLEQLFFAPANWILESSNPANGMYFIKSGQVELHTLERKISSRLMANSSFAEDALINHWEMNPFHAKSTGDSEVWYFSRATFNSLVADWPGMKDMLSNMVTRAEVKKRRSSLQMSPSELSPFLEKYQSEKAKVLKPGTLKLQVWKCLVMFALTYHLLVIPFRISFMYDHGKYYDNNPNDVPVSEEYNKITVNSVILDYVCDLILCCDVVIRMFFLAFYNEEDLIVQKLKIFKRYRLQEHFVIDLISSLPLEVVLFAAEISSWKLSVYQAFSILRINKLLRGREVAHIADFLEKSALKRGIKVKKNTLKISKLMIFTFFCSHYFGCIFFFLALRKHLADRTGSWADNSCIMGNKNTDPSMHCGLTEVGTTTQYIHSIYWATATLTTVGYGDISASLENMPEIYFNIIALVVGTLIYTYIIANLEDIVAQLDVTMTLFKKQVDGVKAYMNQQALDDELSGNILSYFDYLWEHQSGMNGNVVLKYMPKVLAKEVRQEMIGHQVKDLFFVKDTHRDFVALFTNTLSLSKFMPGDVLFYSGEICHSLYFLFKGSVKLSSQTTGVAYTTLSDTVIGEGEFFMRALQPCTSNAEDHAEAFVLTWDAFWGLLNQERISKEFKTEYKENAGTLKKKSVSHLIEKVKSNLANAKMQKLMMEKVGDEEFKYWVANPDGSFVRVWEGLSLFATVYYVINIPYKFAFVGNVRVSDAIAYTLFEIFFCVDIYLRFRHFAIVTEGQLVRDRKKFSKHYMFHGGMFLDVVSVLPVFLVVALKVTVIDGDIDDGWIWAYNFFQFLRIRRSPKYLKAMIDLIEYGLGYRASNGAIRIFEIFLLVGTIAHWMACSFFFIGRMIEDGGRESWLTINEVNDPTTYGYTTGEQRGLQYINALYWALYTISTTGYGNIGLGQDEERIFAMFAMIIGAIICDAGITAVLTALIENRDHQAGTNSRRLDCTKKYMTLALEGKIDKQNAVLEYFNYEDTELNNIDATTILNKLSEPLRLSVITSHCEDILLNSEVVGKAFSRGVLCSIMRTITTQIAIPDEVIIDMNSKEDRVYILHQGRAKSLDDVGGKGALQAGTIISNLEEEKRMEQFGLPKYSLRAIIHSARNLPKTDLFGACDPYIEILFGEFAKIKSTVKKVTRQPIWKEIYYSKVTDDCQSVRVNLYDWNRVEENEFVGGFTVPITQMRKEETKEFTLFDENGGTNVGSVTMTLHYGRLAPHQCMKSHRLTVQAETFCHLYCVDTEKLKEYAEYLSNQEKDPADRLPETSFEENVIEEYVRKTRMFSKNSAKNMLKEISEDIGSTGIRLSERNMQIVNERLVREMDEDDDIETEFLDEGGEGGDKGDELPTMLSQSSYEVAGPDSSLEATGMFAKKKKKKVQDSKIAFGVDGAGGQDSMFKPRKTSIRKYSKSAGGGADDRERMDSRAKRFTFGFNRNNKKDLYK